MREEIKDEIMSKVMETPAGRRMFSLIGNIIDENDFDGEYTDEQIKADSKEIQRIVNYEKKKRNIME